MAGCRCKSFFTPDAGDGQQFKLALASFGEIWEKLKLSSRFKFKLKIKISSVQG
jgi:hypothetical protein